MRKSRTNSLPQFAIVMAGFTLTILLLESEALSQWAQRLEVGGASTIAVHATGNLRRFLQPLNVEWLRRESLSGLDRLGWSDDPARLEAAQRALASTSLRTQPCASTNSTAGQSTPGHSVAPLSHSDRIPLSEYSFANTPPTVGCHNKWTAARRRSHGRLDDGCGTQQYFAS